MTTPTVWQLARLAECSDPDNSSSHGASWLQGLRAIAEEIAEEELEHDEIHDRISEAADSAVPVYTAEVWQVFTDLGAWKEDPTDLGCDGSDMEQSAKSCLYLIAERLLHALNENEED